MHMVKPDTRNARVQTRQSAALSFAILAAFLTAAQRRDKRRKARSRDFNGLGASLRSSSRPSAFAITANVVRPRSIPTAGATCV